MRWKVGIEDSTVVTMEMIGGLFLFDIVEEMWVFIRYPQGRLGQTAVNRRCHVSMQRFRRGESLWLTTPRAGLESTAKF